MPGWAGVGFARVWWGRVWRGVDRPKKVSNECHTVAALSVETDAVGKALSI